MDNLETMLKEACLVCGAYRCNAHAGFVKCSTCGCKYDTPHYLGCPNCLEKEGKPIYRPTLKEVCSLCRKVMKDGDEVYTDGSPMCAICLECAAKHELLLWWKVRVKIGRIWTEKEVSKEKYKG